MREKKRYPLPMLPDVDYQQFDNHLFGSIVDLECGALENHKAMALERSICTLLIKHANLAYSSFNKYPINDSVKRTQRKKDNLDLLREDSPGSIVAQTMRLGRIIRKIKGKTAITAWRLAHPQVITSKTQAVAMAFEKATFAVLRLDKSLQHGASLATNIITGDTCILMDKGLSESRMDRCFLISSFLNRGEYWMTSGGSVPLSPYSPAGKSALTLLKKHLKKVRAAKGAVNLDVIDCVRELYGFCLRSGALEQMTVK